MCGITGICGERALPEVAQQMTDLLQHRGPDGAGLWHESGVALGHRRLKILDLSEAGRQPMSTRDGRYTIVYNGEVYNYLEIREELSDVDFYSQSDTEVILYAYVKWGADCLKKFVGMFSFAIWDNLDKKLFCARDRFGIKPFYYFTKDDTFYFSSEIKSLLKAGADRSVNNQILYDFLARDYYEHADETFFQGILKLPAASWAIVKHGGIIQTKCYWHLSDAVEEKIVSSDPVERERGLLAMAEDAVKLHLRSDVPVGVALSGGLDSATLLSLLDKVHSDPGKVEAFSFAFKEKEYSERPFVEKMAAHTGRKAHFIELGVDDFIGGAEELSHSQGEPYAGVPIYAYAECFALAREKGFVVIMDGSGLDEGLAGYTRFLPALWADMFLAGDLTELESELRSVGITTKSQRERALLQIKETISPTSDSGKGQDLTSSVKTECLAKDFVLAGKASPLSFNKPFPDTLRNLMYRELTYTKLPRALRFRDRLSMNVGMELRPPFLDHRLIEYEFSLPREDYIHLGVSKNILRRAATKFLPDATRNASKQSVQTPQREWFRGELQEWVRGKVDQQQFWNRGWIDRKSGLRAMEEFFQGKGDNSFFLWQWINLEMWAEEYLDTTL